jgi:HK97 family phage major capsid protein
MENETSIYQGDAIKAMGDGKVSGYLVRFGSKDDLDLTGDYFSKDTEFGVVDGGSLPVYYQHGQDTQIGIKSIGRGTVKFDDVGLWIDAQLNLRDEYEKAVYQLAEAGKLGWSSGAAAHLVEKDQIGKAWHVKSWPIAEASTTPTPAEYRNIANTIKSLIPSLSAVAEVEESIKTEQPTKQEVNMTEDEIKAMLEQVAESAADAAVKKYGERQADVKASYDVTVVDDETDRAARLNPFKSAGEFLQAVKSAALSPSETDKRLLSMKSQGANEAIPSQGGFLVQQDMASGIVENMWGTGSVLSRFNPINVSGNGMLINVVDEASRADGYRAGGILGYWLEEGGSKTATKPKFRQIDLKLKKVAAVCYATDELLEDATALESWINNTVPNELRFQTEAAIINGNGVGKPLGILQSPAYYELARVDAAEIDATDVSNMWAHRYVGATDYVWFVSTTIFPQLQTMAIGYTPVYMPPGGMSASPYGLLFGRPVIETEYNPSLGISGDIVLASPSQYSLITKGGVQAASSIHVSFLTDETAFRFVFRVDGEPSWASKAASYYASSDYVSPFVGLLASS